MNNHSNIWKNITMIIFLIFLLVIFLILLIKFKLVIYFEINGINCYVKIKFLYWEIKRKGSFFIRDKEFVKAKVNKELKRTKKNSNNKILSGKLRLFKSKKQSNSKKILFEILKRSEFDKLELLEEIGLLEPSITAYTLPIISTITFFFFRKLNLNYNNFKYKINPLYTDLKFKLILEAQVSVKLIKIILSIINEKMHKLILLRKKY